MIILAGNGRRNNERLISEKNEAIVGLPTVEAGSIELNEVKEYIKTLRSNKAQTEDYD